MATSYLDPSFRNNGDYPNGVSITSVPNGFYRVLSTAAPSEGLPSGFSYCVLQKMTVNSGYTQAILTDIYGRMAVWSTQNSVWVVKASQ